MSCRAMSLTPTSASTLVPNPRSTRAATEAHLRRRSLRNLSADIEEKASSRSLPLSFFLHSFCCFEICLEFSLEASLWLLLRLLGFEPPPDKIESPERSTVTRSKPRLKRLSPSSGCLSPDVGRCGVCEEENENSHRKRDPHITFVSFSPLLLLRLLSFFASSSSSSCSSDSPVCFKEIHTSVGCLFACLFVCCCCWELVTSKILKTWEREKIDK